MKCMCAQTRPQFILSSERVFGGMEFEPMLTPRKKSPLPENFPRGGSNPRRCGQRAQTLPTSYSGPLNAPFNATIIIIIIIVSQVSAYCMASLILFTFSLSLCLNRNIHDLSVKKISENKRHNAMYILQTEEERTTVPR